MKNSCAKSAGWRSGAAGFALLASASLSGGMAGLSVAMAEEINVLQAPAGVAPSGPVPEILSGQADPISPDASSEPVGPRRIVPPGYGAAYQGQGDDELSSGSDAAPTRFFPAGTRPTEPQTRTLSAVPGAANSGIVMNTLSGVSAGAVGLLSQQEGGFGPAMWQGASRADIDSYLSRLPVPTRSPVMNDLARRLLLTGAQPPEGSGDGGALLAIRLDRLLAAGDAEAALALGRSAGRERSPVVAVPIARAALAEGDDNLACDTLKDIPPGNDPAHDAIAAFAVKLSTYCQIAGGNTEIASLTMDLAREEGYDDALFYSLAGQAALGIVLRAPEPNKLDIVDLAFYRLAERELPANAPEIVEPALLRGMVANPDMTDEAKIIAAERAAAFGLMRGADLAFYYGRPKFTPEQMAGLVTSDIAEGSALRRAMIHQALRASVAADERIFLFRLAFATAEAAGLYYPTLEALYPELEQLVPSDALRPLAPAASRAFVAMGERSKAQEWLALLEADAGQVLGRDRRELASLMRIASGSPQSFDTPRVSAEIIADLKSGVKTTQIFAASEAMLLEALGFQLTPEVWEALLDARGALTGRVPPEAVLGQLDAASRKGAIGETVMLALDVVGQSGPGGIHPRAVAQVVAALKAINLENEARRLALEAILGRSNAGRG